ncbi:MAG TPA: hypothetical protein VFA28_13255 [Bryobacteraceae bacterium]|nr:hypothetical protein [Bryobacteraceae bacterium]
MVITYEQVFGVAKIGDELREGQGVNYKPCPAVASLRKLLTAHPYLAGGKVQGTGPLYVKGPNTHEFTRHHAGLAVDIMLDSRNTSEFALGQELVHLFRRNVAVMKWRSIIYANLMFGPTGGVSAGGGHEDHIHIDWHDPSNVRWLEPINSIPLRLKSGQLIQLTPKQKPKIAKSITWTAEAETDFATNPTITRELADVMTRHSSGSLSPSGWNTASLSGKTALLNVGQLSGKWQVSIGDWNGLFYFDERGGVSWANSEASRKHPGRWSVNGSRLEWKFLDPGDFRVFTVNLPLDTKKMSGTILPAGQGWFTMSKAGLGIYV